MPFAVVGTSAIRQLRTLRRGWLSALSGPSDPRTWRMRRGFRVRPVPGGVVGRNWEGDAPELPDTRRHQPTVRSATPCTDHAMLILDDTKSIDTSQLLIRGFGVRSPGGPHKRRSAMLRHPASYQPFFWSQRSSPATQHSSQRPLLDRTRPTCLAGAKISLGGAVGHGLEIYLTNEVGGLARSFTQGRPGFAPSGGRHRRGAGRGRSESGAAPSSS
jgi:hypothetical protein